MKNSNYSAYQLFHHKENLKKRRVLRVFVVNLDNG